MIVPVIGVTPKSKEVRVALPAEFQPGWQPRFANATCYQAVVKLLNHLLFPEVMCWRMWLFENLAYRLQPGGCTQVVGAYRKIEVFQRSCFFNPPTLRRLCCRSEIPTCHLCG